METQNWLDECLSSSYDYFENNSTLSIKNDQSSPKHWEAIFSSESLATIVTSADGKSKQDEPLAAELSDDSDARLCLTELNVSDSHLKLFNYRFPMPEDPGLVPGFWILYPKPPYFDVYGDEKFKYLINLIKLPQIRKISQMFKSDEINLSYYGLRSRVIRALCETTFFNTTVKSLNLQGNWLDVDACFHLNDLLLTNETLISLNLCGCRIGPRGAKKLQQGIGMAPSLRYLNLRQCDLSDQGLQYIAIGVYCSSSLSNVDLSDNGLSIGSREALQTMLTQTDSLARLNLSWNSLASNEFWKMFALGLDRNKSLIELDISWNGLENECVPFLATYLSAPSCSLRKFNLEDNKLGDKEVMQIVQALTKNVLMESIDLGNNPINANVISEIVKKLLQSESQLRYLGLKNLWANKDVVPLLEEGKNKEPTFEINLEGIFSNYKLIGPDQRKIFLKRANYEAMNVKKIKHRKNFGHFVLSLEDSIVSKEHLEKSVKRYKIKLTKSLVEEIMNAFTIGDDAIDQRALKTFYMNEYPDTEPAPPKPVKKKKKKKGKNIYK